MQRTIVGQSYNPVNCVKHTQRFRRFRPAPSYIQIEMVWAARLKNSLAAAAECVAVVAVATGVVAVLDSIATAAGLGVVYVLAVMFVAIRRGELPALGTAALSVLAFNFFFIEPRHRLTIADDHNVVALGVLLVAGFVVARLAGLARARAEQAPQRAQQAPAREGEAELLAQAAAAPLAPPHGRPPPGRPGPPRAP